MNRWQGLIIAGAVASLLQTPVAVAANEGAASSGSPTVHTYSFGGRLHAFSRENAVSSTVLGFWAPLHIHADGSVTGTGVVRYEWAAPCRWEAPVPIDKNNCTLKAVTDGSFTVSGRVTQTVHRHDDGNPYKEAAFELLDFQTGAAANETTRAGYAPLRMSLTMQPAKLPAELVKLYGLSGGNVEERQLGMSALGMAGSGAFFRAFEILVLPNTATAGGGDEQFRSAGHYDQGADVFGTGVFSFYMIDASRLPIGTDPSVLETHEDNTPVPRPLLDYELKAIDAYAQDGFQPPRNDFDNLAEGYLDLLNALPLGSGGVDPFRASGIGLTDDTRPNSNK